VDTILTYRKNHELVQICIKTIYSKTSNPRFKIIFTFFENQVLKDELNKLAEINNIKYIPLNMYNSMQPARVLRVLAQIRP
jgi:hypothetical protein